MSVYTTGSPETAKAAGRPRDQMMTKRVSLTKAAIRRALDAARETLGENFRLTIGEDKSIVIEAGVRPDKKLAEPKRRLIL